MQNSLQHGVLLSLLKSHVVSDLAKNDGTL